MDNQQCTVYRSIRWAIKQPLGWVSIAFEQRVHKTMQRSFKYTDLLEIVQIARRKVSINWLKANLSIEHLWIMWAISRRDLALPIHRMNTTQLATELPIKGLTLTP